MMEVNPNAGLLWTWALQHWPLNILLHSLRRIMVRIPTLNGVEARESLRLPMRIESAKAYILSDSCVVLFHRSDFQSHWPMVSSITFGASSITARALFGHVMRKVWSCSAWTGIEIWHRFKRYLQSTPYSNALNSIGCRCPLINVVIVELVGVIGMSVLDCFSVTKPSPRD